MTAASLIRAVSFATSAGLTAAALGCSSDKGSASSGRVVSCDITQGELHYCEEFHGAAAGSTGCPMMMAGFTPGTGCSRDGVAGTCSEDAYDVFFYGAGDAQTVASICPGGTFQAPGSDGSGGGGAGGAGGKSGSTPAAVNTSCKVTVSGALTATEDCSARILQVPGVDPDPYIAWNSADYLLGFNVYKVALAAGSYMTGSPSRALGLAHDKSPMAGAPPPEWEVSDNVMMAKEGTYSIQITGISAVGTASQIWDVDGTLDATYIPVESSGAKGELTIHADF